MSTHLSSNDGAADTTADTPADTLTATGSNEVAACARVESALSIHGGSACASGRSRSVERTIDQLQRLPLAARVIDDLAHLLRTEAPCRMMAAHESIDDAGTGSP